MSGFSARALLPVLCWLCLPVCSQEANVVRIGVAVLRSSTDKSSATEARDRLVKALNQRKPDKKLKSLIQSVALEAPQGSPAIEEGKAKDCEFVLLSRLAGLQTSERSVPSANNNGLDAIPVMTAKIEYQLMRVSDGAEYAVGSVTSEAAPSIADAVMDGIRQLAVSVLSELRKGGNVPHREAVPPDAIGAAKPATGIDLALIATDFCKWLPTNIPHSEALRGICEYAISLPQKMPNFVCNQETSRYRGDSRVPRDLITASVRYEDGAESYSAIQLNGKPAPSAISESPGLWSTGEFGSNLRAIFDLGNNAVFKFSKEIQVDKRTAWVFTYQIARQNDPLWRLHGGDAVVAPPYGGELWVDQKSGELLRFRSTATNIPPTFPMLSAELLTEYDHVAFGDGAAFVLPVTATVATRFRGEEATRNVAQFRNCQKFRAKARMVLNVPGSTDASLLASGGTSGGDVQEREAAESNTIYAILREQAIREDAARLEAEQRAELEVASQERLKKLSELEKEKQTELARVQPHPKTEQKLAALEAVPSFKVNVNLVQVSVVAGDARGRTVGSLRKEDFHLFDDGRPQTITSFSVERSGAAEAKTPRGEAKGAESEDREKDASPVKRDVAYVFDDIHATFADLASSRDAAARHIGALRPEDRAAVYTTSGEVTLRFTSDRNQLQEALRGLRPHPLMPAATCPPLTYYMAGLIVEGDLDALSVAIQDAIQCALGGMASSPTEVQRAEQIAKTTALEVVNAGRSENQSTLGMLREVVRSTVAAPGSRIIVLVSPGFMAQSSEIRQGVMELIDRAVRANIVIHALDVKGLYTPGVSGNSRRPGSPAQLQLSAAEASTQSEVMAELAYGTGGTYFHNNNDLEDGFRRTADAPEYIYVLGFSPQKLDGKFHKLKVTLGGIQHLTLQARQGYYASKAAAAK